MSNEARFQEQRRQHWDQVARRSQGGSALGGYYHGRLEQVYAHLIAPGQRVLEIGCARGDLLAALKPSAGVGVDFSPAMIRIAKEAHPQAELSFVVADAHRLALDAPFDAIVVSDVVNDLWDVQAMLERLRPLTTARTRIVLNFFSRLWELPLRLTRAVGLATPMLEQNWLTVDDVAGLLRLAGFEPIRNWREVLWPVRTPLVDTLFNRFMAKLAPLNHLALTNFLIARPTSFPSPSDVFHRARERVSAYSPTGEGLSAFSSASSFSFSPSPTSQVPSPTEIADPHPNPLPGAMGTSLGEGKRLRVSVIVPARNEAGNVPAIMERIPEMGGGTEIVFVEGHSKDDTYAAIERAIAANPQRSCKLFRQTGKGKGDAVRLGFQEATGDILMILDADLTVAPEDLPRFYQAVASGTAEFVNGVRLVYPMEKEAMRFLNLLGNKFFGMAFSWLLGQSIKDTLCGTKVLSKSHYELIAQNRAYFGDFDPFGDFDLIFGAAKLNLKIVDLPIRYGQRTYGSTNIDRWKHGWLLLRMTVFAARRLKFV